MLLELRARGSKVAYAYACSPLMDAVTMGVLLGSAAKKRKKCGGGFSALGEFYSLYKDSSRGGRWELFLSV